MIDRAMRKLGRRDFLGAAAGAGIMFIKPERVRGTAANSAIRLGLLGCGGRGTHVATSFVHNTPARIVALGDLFADQLAAREKYFNQLGESLGHAKIDPALLFRGPKAYEQIAACKDLDAIIIATPDYFHAEHLDAVVAAGKHVYCEKPAGVDVHSCQRVAEIGEKARGRLSLEIGFQLRSAPPLVEMVRLIQAGALGKISVGEAYYFTKALNLPDWPNASPVERRLRQWYWDRTLSGDFIVDQNIHVFDICNWVLQAHPRKATGTGGRKGRTDSGDCWGHFAVTFFYPDDVHVNFTSTQFGGGYSDVCERFFGTRGASESHYTGGVRIYGEEPWDADPQASAPTRSTPVGRTSSFDALKDADAEKDKAFIESIISGKFHNQAAAGAEAALTAILARTAAYTGREVTWEELLRSGQTYDAGIDLSQFA